MMRRSLLISLMLILFSSVFADTNYMGTYVLEKVLNQTPDIEDHYETVIRIIYEKSGFMFLEGTYAGKVEGKNKYSIQAIAGRIDNEVLVLENNAYCILLTIKEYGVYTNRILYKGKIYSQIKNDTIEIGDLPQFNDK